MTNYVVSIIIPCYNDAQYVEQAVNSVLNQTYSNIEVIVVDDGSNSETKAILKEIEHKIHLITQENQGQSTARNVGINAAIGDFILVLDSDDYFEPSFCEEALNIIDANSNIKLVTCEVQLIYSNGEKAIFRPKGGNISNFMYYNDALGSCFFKRKDWLLCGGYDVTMRKGLEDWEFYIRMLKNGGTCYVIPKVLFNYRRRNNSTTSKASPFKFDILNYIFNKHKYLYSNDIENLIQNFSTSLKSSENERIKVLNSKEYKIGYLILKPFRFIKKNINIILNNDKRN